VSLWRYATYRLIFGFLFINPPPSPTASLAGSRDFIVTGPPTPTGSVRVSTSLAISNRRRGGSEAKHRRAVATAVVEQAEKHASDWTTNGLMDGGSTRGDG